MGPIKLIRTVQRAVLPDAERELQGWLQQAQAIPTPELQRQAVASIQKKRFHCQGGTVYATMADPAWRLPVIRLIVALQTISDYLDNLCDRSTSLDGEHFLQLHQAMLDAVDLTRPLHDYYRLGQEQEDGGYLVRLVQTCRQVIATLPAYHLVQAEVKRQVTNYVHLQVYKHVERSRREELLQHWWKKFQPQHPKLYWQEFAAATGSTLGIFALFVKATDPQLKQGEVEKLATAYFPAIMGLHILLDYLIDQEEDRQGGDLNFIQYYTDLNQTVERLKLFVRKAREQAQALHPFHQLIVDGLLAIYLSDQKVGRQAEVKQIAQELLRDASWRVRYFAWQGRIIRGITGS